MYSTGDGGRDGCVGYDGFVLVIYNGDDDGYYDGCYDGDSNLISTGHGGRGGHDIMVMMIIMMVVILALLVMWWS